MSEKVLLGIIDNKRPDLLDQTIKSLESNLDYNFFEKVIIDDSGDAGYSRELNDIYGDRYTIWSHRVNMGLSGSIMSLWLLAKEHDVDYVWHQEGDFTFNHCIDLELLKNILKQKPKLAQVALKRQPVNGDEASVGGFMEQKPDTYTEYSSEFLGAVWVEHRNFFTLNPCLYPRWVVDLGWQNGWGEAEFSNLLFSDESVTCAFLHGVDHGPIVNHTGNYRGDGWFV